MVLYNIKVKGNKLGCEGKVGFSIVDFIVWKHLLPMKSAGEMGISFVFLQMWEDTVW